VTSGFAVSHAALTPLDIAACYADYHVYNTVNTKLQSLPPDKDKDKKKKQDKKAVVKPRPGADIYQRKITQATAKAKPVSIVRPLASVSSKAALSELQKNIRHVLQLVINYKSVAYRCDSLLVTPN